MKEKNQKTIKNKINPYLPICIVLAIFSFIVMMYHIYTKRNISVYSFGGYNENITILDGTIYTGLDINRFSAPNILYNGKDYVLKDFTIGYYIGNEKVSVTGSDNKTGLSDVHLSDIIKNTEFTFTENHKDAVFLSKENIKNINNLVFKIEGKSTKDESVSISVPLEITKIN